MLSDKIFDVASATFDARKGCFETLGRWINSGIEGWAQVELGLALKSKGFEVTTDGKIARGCDLLVNEQHGIEIKCATSGAASWLTCAFEQHPKAEMYLFLSKNGKSTLSTVKAAVKKLGYSERNNELNGWFIMLVTKPNSSVT